MNITSKGVKYLEKGLRTLRSLKKIDVNSD